MILSQLKLSVVGTGSSLITATYPKDYIIYNKHASFTIQKGNHHDVIRFIRYGNKFYTILRNDAKGDNLVL